MLSDDLRSWAERIKKTTDIPDIIEFCDAIIGWIVSNPIKSKAKTRRERREYQKNYMKKYRKKQKLGDFAD